MLTLEKLKECGVISCEFETITVPSEECVSASHVNAFTDTSTFKYVIADKCKWVAVKKTKEGKVIDNEILSSDGDKIFCWRNRNQLIEMMFMGEQLATVGIINTDGQESNFRRKLNMADVMKNPMDFGQLGKSDAFEAFNVGGAPAGGAVDGGIQEQNITNKNSKFFTFMQEHGRFCAFVTNDAPTVKASKSQAKIPDPSNPGKFMLVPTATQAERDKYATEGKASASLFQKESIIAFKESKPAVKGGIIAIPEAARLATDAVDDIMNCRQVEFDDSKKETYLLNIPKESLNATILQLFNGKIKEDERILGNKAGVLQVIPKKVAPSEKDKEEGRGNVEKIRFQLQLTGESKEKRKNMVYPGNFIPLKTYVTASQNNPTAEQVLGMNLALEGAIKDAETYKGLSAGTQKLIKWDPSNAECAVTSTYFTTEGTPTEIRISRFYDKDVTLDDVKVAIRQKVAKKDGGMRHVYVTKSIKDVDGPLSMPEYADILTKLGKTPEDFIAEVAAYTKKTSKSQDKKRISIDAALTSIRENNANYSFDNIDISTGSITKLIKGLKM